MGFRTRKRYEGDLLSFKKVLSTFTCLIYSLKTSSLRRHLHYIISVLKSLSIIATVQRGEGDTFPNVKRKKDRAQTCFHTDGVHEGAPEFI